MALKNDLSFFDLRKNMLVSLHILDNFIKSDHHLSAAVFEHIALELDVSWVQKCWLSLHLGVQMDLQFFRLCYEPVDTMKAELSLALAIKDIFTEVELRLVLSHLLNLLLQVS